MQQLAAEALGEREGAVIVIDPQAGRLRAVVNPRLAFEQAYPPGSAIKPFTALAALRAGLLDAETRRQCQTRYAREGFEIVCSHPRSTTPFNLPQALAYSCNDYFAHIGERLSEGTFNAALTGFGFGQRTGVAAVEAAGSLPRGDWRVQSALGDDDRFLVTPVQLLMAFAALVNGGDLFRPQQTSDEAFTPTKLARINISAAHRKILLEGMRGAVNYGTAEKTGLSKLPQYVFGKTGTSTASNGFRTQGWFVGFAADKPATGVPAPQQVKFGVLVFLKRAHGSQAAEVAGKVFDCGLRIADCGFKTGEVRKNSESHNSETNLHRRGAKNAEAAQSFFSMRNLCEAHHLNRRENSEQLGLPLRNLCEPLRLCGEVASKFQPTAFTAANPQSAIRNPQSIKVRSVSENTTRELPLEEYLAGVLAGEASIETELEALKAQAVVSRTFAVRNLGRHAREGYDFCSTTHCQRFVLPKARLHAKARQAVEATRSEILLDRKNQPADVYFHAACGGVTANLETLWGGEAPAYLRGVRDEFCVSMPHRNWTQTISAAQLAKALQSDERTNVGSPLKNVTVSKRDATGRAEEITIEAARRLTVRGWDFKLIVGRALGWQMVKSSRFEVARNGDGFVFRGSGFGHGLGLCQEGAHVMATRRMTYRQIASFYFPGARLSGAQSVRLPTPNQLTIDRLEKASFTKPIMVNGQWPMANLSVAGELVNKRFQIRFGTTNDRREVEAALKILEAARTDLIGRLKTASLRLDESVPFEIVIHATTAEFIAATGLSGWATGATRGRRIELQPLALLKKRGVTTTALRHELAHAAMEVLGKGKSPRWLAEGLCLHFAGEAAALARVQIKQSLSREELERRFNAGASAEETRQLYALAWREVQSLIREKGEAYVWQLATKSKEAMKA
ncbi:MAG: SpoIID/LytB domain-containing protein [Acidobacteriota bacterium]|nr:SpoIID/LytB domain-containing protein [Acidobacteriota bacterium]